MADSFTKTVSYKGHTYELKVAEQTGIMPNPDGTMGTEYLNTLTGTIDGASKISDMAVREVDLADKFMNAENSLKYEIDGYSNQDIYNTMIALGATKD